MDSYMIVYPLPDNYKDTSINRKSIIEKFKKFFEKSKCPRREHIFDVIHNSYKKEYKYVCLSDGFIRPEYHLNMPTYANYENFIILHEDDNNISIGEL